MRFSLTFLVAALAGYVAAQDKPNAFNIPPAGYLLHAGQPTTFTWSNKQGSTVTLMLRDGSNGDLNSGTTIASSITNAGSFTYTPPSDIVEGNSYTIEIIDDQDPSQTNYTPQFDILSPVKAVPTGTNAVTASGAASTGSTGSAASTGTGAASTSGATSTTGSPSTTTGTSKSSASAHPSTTASGSPSASSSVPATNPAPVVKVGGSLLAVAIAFAVAF